MALHKTSDLDLLGAPGRSFEIMAENPLVIPLIHLLPDSVPADQVFRKFGHDGVLLGLHKVFVHRQRSLQSF